MIGFIMLDLSFKLPGFNIMPFFHLMEFTSDLIKLFFSLIVREEESLIFN